MQARKTATLLLLGILGGCIAAAAPSEARWDGPWAEPATAVFKVLATDEFGAPEEAVPGAAVTVARVKVLAAPASAWVGQVGRVVLAGPTPAAADPHVGGLYRGSLAPWSGTGGIVAAVLEQTAWKAAPAASPPPSGAGSPSLSAEQLVFVAPGGRDSLQDVSDDASVLEMLSPPEAQPRDEL